MSIIVAAALIQAAGGSAAPPRIVRPPSDASVRPALKAVGDDIQFAGHCRSLMAPADFDKFLILAQANQADTPYLMGRLTKGMRQKKSAQWCKAHIRP